MPELPNATDCVFCKIVADAIPCFKLLDDEHCIAFMDINPFQDGHCLVVAKGHYPDLYATPDDVLAAISRNVRRLAGAVRDTLQPPGLNLVQANGPAAGQSVLHFHMHILPRRTDDGGALNWGLRPGDMKAIGALAERIKAHLS